MRILSVLALILWGGAAMAADPVVGMYKTQPGDDGAFGHVEIYECGAEICGVIRRGFNAEGKEVSTPNIGKRMIWDMRAEGNGAYGGGRIWAPDRDKTYKSKMSLSGNTLKVSGCVFGICRSQVWTRLR